jgi:hypothetical protein
VVLVFSFHSHANESSACRDHRDEVLRKAVSLNPENKMKAEWIFEKTEAEALKFIENFDPKKLEMKENMEKNKEEIAACNDKAVNNKDYGYCQSVFDGNSFIMALASGIKDNKWSETTKQKAMEKLKEYVKEAFGQETQVIFKVTAAQLLQQLSSDGLLKLNARKLKDLLKSLEKKNLRLNQIKPVTCGMDRSKLRQEVRVSAEFQKKFKALLKGTLFQL